MVTGGGSPAGTCKGGGQEEAQRHAQQAPPTSEAVATSWIRDLAPQVVLTYFYCYFNFWCLTATIISTDDNILCVTYFNNMKTSEVSVTFRY